MAASVSLSLGELPPRGSHRSTDAGAGSGRASGAGQVFLSAVAWSLDVANTIGFRKETALWIFNCGTSRFVYLDLRIQTQVAQWLPFAWRFQSSLGDR